MTVWFIENKVIPMMVHVFLCVANLKNLAFVFTLFRIKLQPSFRTCRKGMYFIYTTSQTILCVKHMEY